MVRARYNHVVSDLCDDVLRLGRLVEQALHRAMRSLQTWNATTAGWIIQDDAQIDAARYAIEDRVVGVLATQQPIVASDLRLVSIIASIATELERIGDYASLIARRIKRVHAQQARVSPPPGMYEMAALAQQMLHTSLEAFLHQDCELARSLQPADERVDMFEDNLRTELLDIARANPQQIDAVTDLLDVVHVLERVADRATNIGERVIYLITSELEELNP